MSSRNGADPRRRRSVASLFHHDPAEDAVEDDVDIPVAWYVVGAVAHMIFLAALPQVLWASHFESLYRLNQEANDPFPRFLESLQQPTIVLMMIVAVVLGLTATHRAANGEFKLAGLRLGAIAVAPIVIETTAIGVQDGRPADLDYIPPHSVVLLVLIVAGPIIGIVLDLRSRRRTA